MYNMFNKKIYPILRARQITQNPAFLLFWLARTIFLKRYSFSNIKKLNACNQLNESDTLQHIIKNNLSVMRFGDGEYGLLYGASIFSNITAWDSYSWKQVYSASLKKEMRRLLSLNNKNTVVAIPPITHITHDDRATEKYSHEEKVYSNVHVEARMSAWKFINSKQTYGSAMVFLPRHNKEFDWLAIANFFRNKTIIIVTGDVDKLKQYKLGNKTDFIECGKHNAFERRKKIFDDIDTYIQHNDLTKEDSLFLVSMGPTAGCIVEHISNNGLVAWDTGHFFELAEKEISKISQY
jgi:hypothetical protein